MNKRDKLLQYKQIQNGLPRYDLAVKQTASGYQKGDNFNIGIPSIQQGQDMSAEANMYKPSLQGTVNKATPYVSMLKNPVSKIFSQTVDKSIQTGAAKMLTDTMASKLPQLSTSILTDSANALANVGINTGINIASKTMPSFASQVGNFGSNVFGKGIGSQALQKTGEQFAQQGSKTAATSSAKSILGTAGTVASAAGALYGLYDLSSGLAKGPSIPTASMMDQSHNEVTQSVNGVNYTTKNLGDTSAYDRMLKYGENNRILSNSISGIGAGVGSALAAGSLLGTSLGPLGIIGGGLIGGLIGGIGSLFGRGRRKRELQRRKNALVESYANANNQAESVAASEGLRNQFDENSYEGNSLYNADKGKTAVNYNLMNCPSSSGYGMVFDKDGYHLGPINSKVGKGETIVNFDEGKMTYIDKGKKRADDQYSSVQEGDNNYIAGNDIDWTNGISFADQVAPMSKQYTKNEKLRKAIESNKYADEKTKELNLKQLDLMQQQLVESTKEPLNRQEMQHKIQNRYDGTMPQYDKGKFNLNWLQPLIYAGAYGIPKKQYDYYKNSVPQAANSYVPNNNANRAIGILSQMGFDPYQQVQQVRDTYRQGLYNINQQGGLSAGQRSKMMLAHSNNYMANMAKLYGEANDINNKYRQAYAQALMEAGDKDATRQQTALAQQQQAYREAVARRLLGMENANQGRLNLISALGKNIFQQQQFNNTQDYNNRLINLYDRQTDLDEKKFARDLANDKDAAKQPTQTYSNSAVGVQPTYNPHGKLFGDRLYRYAVTKTPVYEHIRPSLYLLSAPGYPLTESNRQYNNWWNSLAPNIRDIIKPIW